MTRRVAIIGAGIAGLAAGRGLSEAGLAVRLFEKSRGLGGRLSWRRAGAHGFDHGAQFATATTPDFSAYLEAAAAAGAAARWPAAEAARDDGRAAYVGMPGMSRLAGPLAAGLDVSLGVRVAAATRSDDGWRLGADDGAALGRFDALVMAIPAPQALALFDGHPLAEPLGEAAYAPCWTGLFAFDRPVDVPNIARAADGPLAWLARDGSKPGRVGETIVVQAGPDWSRTNLERAKEGVAADLLAALRGAHPFLPAPVHADAHRWRYAMVERALGRPCVHDADAALAFCGDYCLGARVEAAFRSGRAAGEAVARSLRAADDGVSGRFRQGS